MEVKKDDKYRMIELGKKYKIRGLQSDTESESETSDSDSETDCETIDNPTKTIYDLPPEILIKILSRLTTYDLGPML
jgi:hypothetical protein